MSDKTITDNARVAHFTSTRLFPMIDEFAQAHEIEVSVESGILSLLVQRLLYQHHTPEAVTVQVSRAFESFDTAKATAAAPPVPYPAPSPPIFQDDGPNVVRLVPRPKP